MITHFFHRLGILGFLFLAIACNVNKGKSVTSASQMKDTLVFTGCQEKISLKTGSTVEIRLDAIQGTGYQWIADGSSPLLQQLGPEVLEYTSPDNKENMPGQSGFQILRFKALKKGEGVMQLVYKRTFENTIEKSCHIKIEIE